MSEQNTLKALERILSEDKSRAEKAEKMAEKGDAPYPVMSGPGSPRLEIKKADAGGIILCWYGPSGSREIVAKDVKEAVPLIEKFFSMEDE